MNYKVTLPLNIIITAYLFISIPITANAVQMTICLTANDSINDFNSIYCGDKGTYKLTMPGYGNITDAFTFPCISSTAEKSCITLTLNDSIRTDAGIKNNLYIQSTLVDPDPHQNIAIFQLPDIAIANNCWLQADGVFHNTLIPAAYYLFTSSIVCPPNKANGSLGLK